MNRNYRAVWVLAASALLAAGGYYLSSATRDPQPAEEIAVAFVDLAGDAPLIVAHSQGFFREQDLEVAFTRYPTGVRALKSLREGRVDFASASEFPVVRAVLEQPKPALVEAGFLVIGDVSYSNRSQRVIVRSDREIRSPADLKGKRVGIPAGNTSIDFYLGNMLRQHGIAEAEVEAVPLEIGMLGRALEKGDIDALIAWEPLISDTQAKLGERALVFPGNPYYSTSWLILVREELAKRKPGLLPRFLRAIKKGERFIQEHPGQAIEAVARHSGIDAGIVARTWASLEFRVSLSQALIGAMEDEARWLIANRRTAATEVPNFLDYIHVDPLKEISPATVTLIK